MKLLYVILAVLALIGCEKSSNVSALQEEATGIANQYSQRFDKLEQRTQLLGARADSMKSYGAVPEMDQARQLYKATSSQLRQLQAASKTALTSIANAAKSDDARVELIKLMAELKERFERGNTEVTSKLDEIETWLAYVPLRAQAVAMTDETHPETDAANPDGTATPPTDTAPAGDDATPGADDKAGDDKAGDDKGADATPAAGSAAPKAVPAARPANP
jgi:hypothetical protein